MSRSFGPCTWLPHCTHPAIYEIVRKLPDRDPKIEKVCERHWNLAEPHGYEILKSISEVQR